MKLYAMVWKSNDMVWYFNTLLCFGVFCKRYEWTDCKNGKKLYIIHHVKPNNGEYQI